MRDKPDPKLYNDRFKPLAVLLEGEFNSNFKNRIPATIAHDSAIDFKAKSIPTKMIVVSDGDVIRNHLGKQKGSIIPLGYDVSTKQTYGNRDFILNSIDYLCDDSGLITVRSKELKLRLLDTNKVDEGRIKWQLINLIAPSLLIILFGVIRNFMRRRKYGV
jgi:ABC-2 type transport system permease protein